MKQVFFLHSAGLQGPHEGSSDFVSWLSANLGPEYEVIHPIMPSPEDPDYEPWKTQLHKKLAELQGDVILVGHSLGGAVLLKYLTEERITASITGLFLCATPFWGADSDWQYEPFTLPDNFVEMLPNIPAIHLYHSKNDPYVPFSHFEQYKQAVPQAIAHEISGDSHAFDSGLPQLAKDIKAL
jgi:predicted alpha/beta hydrolase family esterase